jgi:hypothetical protein
VLPATPTVEQRSMLGLQRRSSAAFAPVTSPTGGESPFLGRQILTTGASSASGSRPIPVSLVAPESGRGRNRQLSITIVPAPARQTATEQAVRSPVLGRQLSDLGRQVPDDGSRD